MAAMRAVVKLAMAKPGTMREVSRSKKALMTKVKRPRVMRLMGSVKKVRMGLTIAERIPQMMATTSNVSSRL